MLDDDLVYNQNCLELMQFIQVPDNFGLVIKSLYKPVPTAIYFSSYVARKVI